MKKILLALALSLLCLSAAQAQRKIKGNGKVMTRERRLTAFNKVSIYGDFEVVFLNNPFEKKILISGDTNLQSLVHTKVENNQLVIKYRQPVTILSYTEPLKIRIPSRDVSEIINHSSADISNLGAIELPKFTLINKGDGKVTFKVKTQEINVTQEGKGKIYLSGNSDSSTFKLNSQADVDARNMSSFFTQATLTSKGNLYTNTTSGIDAEINGDGNLYYKATKTVNVTNQGKGKALKL